MGYPSLTTGKSGAAMGKGVSIPTIVPGEGTPPQVLYTQQVPSTVFPLGGTTFHSVLMRDAAKRIEKGPGEELESSVKAFRRYFIRIVYIFSCIQLMVILGIASLFMYHPGIKAWTQENHGLYYGALALMLVTAIAMACCEKANKEVSLCISSSGLLSVAEGFVLGTYPYPFPDTNTLMLAVAIAVAVNLVLTLFSFQTKWEFTVNEGIRLVVEIVLFIFGVLMIFLRDTDTFSTEDLLGACVGALVFSAFVVYGTLKRVDASVKKILNELGVCEKAKV